MECFQKSNFSGLIPTTFDFTCQNNMPFSLKSTSQLIKFGKNSNCAYLKVSENHQFTGFHRIQVFHFQVWKNTLDLQLASNQSPFHRTSNGLLHHFSKIKQTQTCSSFSTWTRTSYFWFRTNICWTSNLIGPIT